MLLYHSIIKQEIFSTPAKEERNYKDTLFRMIFREPKELSKLYNAINGTDYQDHTKLEIVTLENAIYMNMKIPTPYFVVFYNGLAEQPERKEMKLSDSYITPVDDPALELKVIQLNIGIGHNKVLMGKCPLLAQYAEYVGRVQKYVMDMPLAAAVEYAVNECIQDDILADFLQKSRLEAIAVSNLNMMKKRNWNYFGPLNAKKDGTKEGQKEEMKLYVH